MAVVKLPVLVVGEGIGGFTAALVLHRAGISNRLTLQEKSFSSTERSAVLVGGSAVRILDRLGLGPRFRTYGSPITHAEIKTERQRQLISLDFERIGSEVWVVPRSNLLQFFVEALPPGTVHFGTKLRSLAANSESIEAEVQHDPSNSLLRSGPKYSSNTSRISAKLVVGADGLSSTVRTFVSRPSIAWPSGTYIWQAVVKNRDHEMYPPHFGSEVWASSKSKLSRASRFGIMRISKDDVLWWALVPDMEEVFYAHSFPNLFPCFRSTLKMCRGYWGLLRKIEIYREDSCGKSSLVQFHGLIMLRVAPHRGCRTCVPVRIVLLMRSTTHCWVSHFLDSRTLLGSIFRSSQLGDSSFGTNLDGWVHLNRFSVSLVSVKGRVPNALIYHTAACKTSARIALVGDTGRTADPSNVHQGCSSAIEDSYMLAHYIPEQGGPESLQLVLSLRAYEQNREFQSTKPKLYSDRFYRLSTSNSPISRYILRKYVLSPLENEISRGIALTLAT